MGETTTTDHGGRGRRPRLAWGRMEPVLNLRRGPGAYALLSRADGQLTRRASTNYFTWACGLPARTSTTTSPSRMGANGQKKQGGVPADQAGQGLLPRQVLRVPGPSSVAGGSGRNAGVGYERRLPVNELGGATRHPAHFTEEQVGSRLGPRWKTLLRQRIRGLRSVSFQLPCEEDVLPSAFKDKPLCVPRQPSCCS